jgi:hypothetical protein
LLAQNVPVIQKKVYDFAQEAIEYIQTLIEIVGEEQKVKEDLKKIWCVSFCRLVASWIPTHV